MEALRDTPLKEKFRFLLIHIGNELHTKNCKALKFGYQLNLGSRDQDEDGLDILSELMKRGKFDTYSPNKLQEILENIGRKDLADAAKEYKKSSLFKEEMRRRKKKVDKPKQSSDSHMPEELQSSRHAEKCLNAVARTLVHMTAMIEQTTSLISSVEVFMDDSSKKEEAQASITETKSKMKELSKAIQETAMEVQSTKDDKDSQRKKGCTQMEKLVTDVQRTRSSSDGVPKHAYVTVESPSMKLKPLAWSKQAVMMMWMEKSHKKKLRRRSSSDSDVSSQSSIASTASSEDTTGEERYVSTDTVKKNHRQDEENTSTSGRVDTPEEHVYDDPDCTKGKPQRRPYVNILIQPLEGQEAQSKGEDTSATQPETPDSRHCYENVTFGPLEQTH